MPADLEIRIVEIISCINDIRHFMGHLSLATEIDARRVDV